jgi:hypothetical protein
MRLANGGYGGGGANHRRLDLRCSPAQVVPGVDLVEGGALARVKKGSKRITKNSSKINSKLNVKSFPRKKNLRCSNNFQQIVPYKLKIWSRGYLGGFINFFTAVFQNILYLSEFTC